MSRAKPKGSNLNDLVASLTKKKKMGTLQKSKLDWDAYKTEEQIQAELQAHLKSKDR